MSDLRFTVNQAVQPVGKGITKFNEKLHKISQNMKKNDKGRRTRDDSCIAKSREIRGIDDPLLNGNFSDSCGDGAVKKTKRQRRTSGYMSAESGGESSSEQRVSCDRYQVRGSRWVTKD